METPDSVKRKSCIIKRKEEQALVVNIVKRRSSFSSEYSKYPYTLTSA